MRERVLDGRGRVAIPARRRVDGVPALVRVRVLGVLDVGAFSFVLRLSSGDVLENKFSQNENGEVVR